MPSLGMITINALACADTVLIPVQAAYLPVKGLEQLIKTIGKVKRQLNKRLEIEGILMTMVDTRTNYAKDVMNLVREAYGEKVRIFESSIPTSVRAAEISAEGVSIYSHDSTGKVAKAYEALTREVLSNE
jgi:chromosome partitioning protein